MRGTTTTANALKAARNLWTGKERIINEIARNERALLYRPAIGDAPGEALLCDTVWAIRYREALPDEPVSLDDAAQLIAGFVVRPLPQFRSNHLSGWSGIVGNRGKDFDVYLLTQ